MDKKSKKTLIVSIIALVLVLIGVTYAYFSARITGLESASTISLTAGRMAIQYSEGDENVILNNIYPRSEAWVTKTFTFTGWNTTDQKMSYNIYLNVINNTFPNTYLTYDLRVLESTNGMPVAQKTAVPINGVGSRIIGKGTFTNADGDVHRYELKIYFKDNGKNQNDAQESIFNAKIDVEESKVIVNECIAYFIPIDDYDINYSACESYMNNWGLDSSQITTFCNGGVVDIDETNSSMDDLLRDQYEREYLINNGIIENIVYGEPVEPILYDGFRYVNGQYAYEFIDSQNGWRMSVNDVSSTDPLTTRMCTIINDYPIVSMFHMLAGSNVTSIDLSSFDTSNVTNMSGMFSGFKGTSLDVSYLDTSNVTDMSGMFSYSYIENLDLSSFDTSNVVGMSRMFSYARATNINLSSFDTSNVTDMGYMFSHSAVTTLDLGNFNTSNVTSMRDMFRESTVTNLNISSFDTSKVEDMSGMFQDANLTSLDLSNFDTSSVTTMVGMFADSTLSDIILTSFDTSNVETMSRMFKGISATVLDLSSFDTVKVYSVSEMFKDCSNLTTIYTSPSFQNSVVIRPSVSGTAVKDVFLGCTSIRGGDGTTYNSSKVGTQYMRVDDLPYYPGYFTLKTT